MLGMVKNQFQLNIIYYIGINITIDKILTKELLLNIHWSLWKYKVIASLHPAIQYNLLSDM